MSSFEQRILEGHAKKVLDEKLLVLSIFKGDQCIASGEGQLTTNASGRLHIAVQAESIPFIYDPATPPGQIIPDKEFWKITAKTSDNQTFEAARLHANHFSYKVGELASATFEPRQVKFSLAPTPPSHLSFDLFFAPFEFDFFGRYCRDGIENPVFGDNIPGAWLSVETEEAIVGLRKESELFHCRVRSKATGAIDLEKCAVAFLQALRFCSGIELECLAYTHTTANTEDVVLLEPQTRNERKFYPPLPRHEYEAAEKLLQRSVVFFLQKNSSPIKTALHVCRESQKMTFPAKCLPVCSVVEGLAKYVLKEVIGGFEKLRNELVGSVDTHRNDENRVDLEGRIMEQIQSLIKKEEIFKGKESIWRAAKWLKINLTKDEMAAWSDLRNPLAHGRFDVDIESPTEIQDKLDQAARVANIVNKFVLAMIGYEGTYRDYSTIDYPTCDFRFLA
ncbi:MAG TPA: hypothetical protein VJT54_11060 [Verrucomicrobiae bacterium]|nr:hypothetical protein [Verrucomicrobiae bacterium]